MAKTYYGYKDRETKDIFDWADTGTKISQAIEQEAKSRETRKQDFITANQTFERNITSKIPRSQDASLNNQILAALNTQLDAYYADYKRFTSGEIPENQWVQIRQNRQDGLNNYLGLMQDYATMADEKLNRQVNRESQTWEGESMSQIQGFNDYSKWQMVTDENGTSYMNKVDENGNLIEGPGSRISLALARKQVGTYYNKYNLDAGVKKAVGRFGKTKLAIMKKGVKTREAITNNPQWKSALENISKSELGNPFNRLSVLTEDMGGNVEFVYSEAEAGIDDDGTYKVYMKPNPISKLNEPQFTEEQDKAIYDLFEDMVLTQSDLIEDTYVGQRRQKSAAELSQKQRKEFDMELYRRGRNFLKNPSDAAWKSFATASGIQTSGGKGSVKKGTNGTIILNMGIGGAQGSEIILDPNKPEESLEILYSAGGGSRDFFGQAKRRHGKLGTMGAGSSQPWTYDYSFEVPDTPDLSNINDLRDQIIEIQKSNTSLANNAAEYKELTDQQKQVYNRNERLIKDIENQINIKSGNPNAQTDPSLASRIGTFMRDVYQTATGKTNKKIEGKKKTPISPGQ